MVPCTVGWRGNFFLACAKAVAKDHGIDSGSLFKKTDALHSKGLIAEFARRTAHTVLTFGNDMAHGDFTVDVDQEDAERGSWRLWTISFGRSTKRRRSCSGSRTRRMRGSLMPCPNTTGTHEKPHSGLGETGMGLLR
jgi:hypothetical protein